ncbi:inner centromere protein-like [Neocloeon triangulifer]|uniref:inner centromere protein-like n=1 Tax=Neocloeon triangulifer TaxID=2078957 RepID=UPI00286EDFB4|nr:inner centromere protein-like [Neocloeon triangulifer]
MVQGEAINSMARGSSPSSSSRKAGYDALQKSENERREKERQEQQRRDQERRERERREQERRQGSNWGPYKSKEQFNSMHFC